MESTDPPLSRCNEDEQDVLGCQQELHKTREFLHLILHNANDIIFAADGDGTLVSFNSRAEKALGYSWEEVAGRPVRDLALDPRAFDDLSALCRKNGSSASAEFPFHHKEGNTVYCDVSLMALDNVRGEAIRSVGICRDVTRWKQLQEDLIRVDRLTEIGRTAAGIVHEINNPIAIIGEISGWIGAVAADANGLNREDREEIETAVENIREQTRRCRNITQQLLSFVRESAPAKTSVNVHNLLKETVSFLNPQLKYKEIEVVFQLTEDPGLMNTDKQMLQQVLVNLLSNAIYAVKEKGGGKGRVEIETVKDGATLEIRISDNGTGISEEDQKRMFDLFFTTKPPGKGTGLGLSICQNIIRKLGGTLSFQTEVGEGTSFFVRLPAS